MKYEQIPNKAESGFEHINIDEYEHLDQSQFEEWLKNEEIPEVLLEKVRDYKNINLKNFLRNIIDKLFEVYGDKRNSADSLADSRFTPLSEMIDRGLVSCGAMAKIFAGILRTKKIPVKLIHGDFIDRKDVEDRHSWLEIYNPKTKTWESMDPTEHDFGFKQDKYKKIKEYHSWSEFAEDYINGDY
ncbi:MAG TPA: transglutaminase-like domain-containing protein [bacterium]|nr:transglutaminase-like domain-containing protein [bacterium]